MQIYEITFKTQLNEAPGFSDFASGFTSAITQKIAPGMQSGESSVSIAQGASKKYAEGWAKVVAELMKNTKTQSGAQAISIRDVDPVQLKTALEELVNQEIVTDLSKNQLNDYKTLPSKVDATDANAKQDAAQMVKNIEASIDLILATEPTEVNRTKTASAWANLVTNVYNAVQLAVPAAADSQTQPAQSTQQVQTAQTAQTTASPQRAVVDSALKDLANFVEKGGTITPQQRGAFVNLWKQMGGIEIRESKKKKR